MTDQKVRQPNTNNNSKSNIQNAYIQTFLHLAGAKTTVSDPRYNYTIAGLEELLLQIGETNNIAFLNEGMVRLLGAKNKAEVIDTPLSSWDSGILGQGFLTTLIESTRNSEQVVIIEHAVEKVDPHKLPTNCSTDICGPQRLRFVCTPIKGGVQIVVQDITRSHWLEESFSRYLSPQVISQLRGIPEENLLKSERRVVTILFADLRGFTAFCQKETPVGVAELINEFLTNMVTCIERYDGMVDKFIGDEVMAIFGTPLAREDHALRALLTAVDMVESHKVWSEKRQQNDKYAPPVGVGIATGEVVVGNIGTAKRMEYTVLGHTVNLAARLCGIAGGLEILTVSGTYKAAVNAIDKYNGSTSIPRFRFKHRGKLDLKGIFEPIDVFRVFT
jgi:class 3 adenylate cyclase